jgi:hypothetical protein
MILKYKDLGTALSKNDMKNFAGGKKVGGIWIACSEDRECQRVNLGTCSVTSTVGDKTYMICSG